MNDNIYLIPANSKKSMLIFGLFTKLDLIIFGIGISTSLLLLLLLPVEDVVLAIITLAPGLVCSFLVLPIPNYHNVLTLIKSLIEFFTSRQRYVWKGWCITDEEKQK